jgi:hypothetical protein
VPNYLIFETNDGSGREETASLTRPLAVASSEDRRRRKLLHDVIQAFL